MSEYVRPTIERVRAQLTGEPDLSRVSLEAEARAGEALFTRSGLLVPIGIEIEVPDTFATDDHRALYRLTETATKNGLPFKAEQDYFIEFASRPRGHHRYLVREVQTLAQTPLMSHVAASHPLHITIGDVSFGGHPHYPAEHYAFLPNPEKPLLTTAPFILARTIDLLGATSSQRLMNGSNPGPWIQKKSDVGIRHRHLNTSSTSLGYGSRSAIELRTPEFRSVPQLNEALINAYWLGSALNAAQQQLFTIDWKSPRYQFQDPEHETKAAELAEIWLDFETDAYDILHKKLGLPIIGERFTNSSEDSRELHGRVVMMAYANLLRQREFDHAHGLSSKSDEAIEQLRRLTGATRRAIREAIGETVHTISSVPVAA